MEPLGGMQGSLRGRVAVDRRLVRRENGTGAAIYAEGLRRGAENAGFSVADLRDAPTDGFVAPGRPWRWAAALSPWPVTALPQAGGLLAVDSFRRAQVHFDIYRRYLRLRAAHPPELMHWSYPLPMRLVDVPNLYTVHDLIPLLHPALTPIGAARSRAMLARLRHEATHLVTVSETSRREIIATLGWPPERVTNTYQTVEPPLGDTAAAERATGSIGVEVGGYFLHVGTVERRKNVGRLIEAYRLSGSCRALVLAGPDGWRAAEEMAAGADLLVAAGEAARAAAGRPRVIRADWMERAALLGLIRGGAAVLAPSLAEGFGLPAVEAMALGTPSLTSDSGAPAEVAGPAALLVDPYDVRAMAAAITALDGDAGLRSRLAAAGRERARMFSAAAHAGRLAELYRAVLDGR